MQAASCFVGVQPIFPTKPRIVVKSVTTCLTNNNNNSVKSNTSSARTFKTLSFNYNSPFSVFPAEACEIVGGNACEADEMYPETKLDTQPNSTNPNPNPNAIQHFDREYFDYTTDPKSVLRDEACDDLGGEFCEAS